MSIGTPVSIGGTNSAASIASLTLTTTAAAPAGSVIIVLVQYNGGSGTVSSVTDGTNTYAKLFTRFDSTQTLGTDLWAVTVKLASQLNSSSSLVAHFSSNSSISAIQACYSTGIDPTGDKTNFTEFTGGSTAPTVTTGTLTFANELIIGLVSTFGGGSNITVTDNSPFTQIAQQHGYSASGGTVDLAYDIVAVTTSVTYAPTFSGTAFGDIGVVTFRGTVANTLNVAAGSYALTGVAAALVKGHANVLACAAGAYAITGAAATLIHGIGHFLALAAGSYAITGASALLAYFPGVVPLIRRARYALQQIRTTAPTLDD